MTNGTLTLEAGHYVLRTKPHVRMPVKRLMLGCKIRGDTLTIKRTPDNTEAMLWILSRWPHDAAPHLIAAMRARTAANNDSREQAHAILTGATDAPQPARWSDDAPLRDYQRANVALARIKGGLLIGDDLGLGKTASAIGIIADQGAPALVVCQRHLQSQWAAQIAKFCPTLKTHTIAKNADYRLPRHDVAICSYSKLANWHDRHPWQTVIYDEVQELRHQGTRKHDAATYLATATTCRVGLSATPVYNYAGEIFNVMDCLSPGTMGTFEEFASEWGTDNKLRVKDPVALGSWLRDQAVYIRHTRKQVGRELPPIHKISHTVEHDPKIIDRLRSQCNELAERVLNAGFHEKGVASRQLDIMLRKITGIAKAPFVADFVAQMVESGEQIVLAGWHHQVYEIWERELAKRGIPFRTYHGETSAPRKEQAVKDFVSGAAQVLIISLRSGAGIDGLQTAGRVVVFGELDWAPTVMEQLIGRLARDGQTHNVTAITMIADAGADPIMASVLGAKWEQSTALTDPDKLLAIPTQIPDNRVSELAKAWLAQH